MKRIVFATNNAHKLSEIRDILGDEFDVESLEELGCHDDIPETADTLEGNALQKAHYIYDRYGVSCFADDTGLEVEALGGGPGVYTARFGTMNGYGADHDAEANTRCLLDKLKDKSNRRAQFRTAIALILDGEEHLFEGTVKGIITPEKRGDKGFGYDPVFIADGYDKTFAELGVEVKNKISHRAKAVMKLADFLKNEK
jgi:XTP/dITP diphosphohydrolase